MAANSRTRQVSLLCVAHFGFVRKPVSSRRPRIAEPTRARPSTTCRPCILWAPLWRAMTRTNTSSPQLEIHSSSHAVPVAPAGCKTKQRTPKRPPRGRPLRRQPHPASPQTQFRYAVTCALWQRKVAAPALSPGCCRQGAATTHSTRRQSVARGDPANRGRLAPPFSRPPHSAIPSASPKLHTWQATITPPRSHGHPGQWRSLIDRHAAGAQPHPAPRPCARHPHPTSLRPERQSPTTQPAGRPHLPCASAACPLATATEPWAARLRMQWASPAAAPTPTPSQAPCRATTATRRGAATHPPPLTAAARLLPIRPRYPGPHHLPPQERPAGTPPKAIPTGRHYPCPLQYPRRHRPVEHAQHLRHAPHEGQPPGQPAGRTDHGCTNHRPHPRPPRRPHEDQGWCRLCHRAKRLGEARLGVARHRHSRLAARAATTVTVGPRSKRSQVRPWSAWPKRHHSRHRASLCRQGRRSAPARPVPPPPLGFRQEASPRELGPRLPLLPSRVAPGAGACAAAPAPAWP